MASARTKRARPSTWSAGEAMALRETPGSRRVTCPAASSSSMSLIGNTARSRKTELYSVPRGALPAQPEATLTSMPANRSTGLSSRQRILTQRRLLHRPQAHPPQNGFSQHNTHQTTATHSSRRISVRLA